jgi:hypothetical protein
MPRGIGGRCLEAVNLTRGAVNSRYPSTGESGENRGKRLGRGPSLGHLRRACWTAENAESAGKAVFPPIPGYDAVNLALAATYKLYAG